MLLKEVLKLLDPQEGESYLDLTAGYGGHAKRVIAKTKRSDLAVLVDRDKQAIGELRQLFNSETKLVHQDYFIASKELVESANQFDLILVDLGVSSLHLNEGQRGFSFQQAGPLDMRMDQRQELTADTIVNAMTKEEIERILRAYGEEPKAGLIAEAIVNNRPIKTTTELAALIGAVYGGTYRHHHPATQSFQALRIAVNDELKLLTDSLPLWLKLLAPGGRLAIISFHSLEDRIVKQFLAEYSGNHYDSQLKLLTKHPIRANPSELVHNPRARSAKLRAAVKIKRKGAAQDANTGKKQIPSVQSKS